MFTEKKNKTEEELSLTSKKFDFAFYFIMQHKITNIDSSSNNIDCYQLYFPLSSFMPTFLYHLQLMYFFLQCPYISFRFPLILWLNYVFVDTRETKEIGRDDGVARNIYSRFWINVSNSLFIDEKERISFVRHDLQKKRQEAIGKTLEKGFIMIHISQR